MLTLDSPAFQELRRDFNEWLPAIMEGRDKFTAREAVPSKIEIRDVIATVARLAACKPQDLTGPRQSVIYTRPRFIAYLLAAEMVPCASLPTIGRAFGGRDHTTILHGINKAKKAIAEDDAWREFYESAKREI